jgi:hypothetical protein
MRRPSLLLLASLSVVALSRCDCQDELTELPKPEIEVRDPVSGKTNDDPSNNDDGNEPLVIGFGSGEVGTRAERQVEILSKGTGALTLKAISFAPADSRDEICPSPSGAIKFRSAAEQQVGELDKETGSRTVNVIFDVAGGSHCRILLVRSDDEDEELVKVYFTASGEGPRLCAVGNDTGIIDFGVARPGTEKQKTQRIESCGTRAVRLTDLAIDQGMNNVFRLDAPTSLPAEELPPCAPDGSNAAACGVDVALAFAPTTGGAFQGTLKVTTQSAAGDVVYPFQLLGQGAECQLTVTPLAVHFGAVANGQHADQTVLLRNSGVCHCQVDAITAILPADVGFSFVSPPATPLVLRGTQGCDGDPAPGDGAASTKTLVVRYTTPTRTDAVTDNASFKVQAAGNSAAAEFTVTLEAMGGGAPRCVLEVEPKLPATSSPGLGLLAEDQANYKRWGLIKFGNTVKHNTKRMPITLTNMGNVPCEVTGLAWDKPVTAQHNFGMEDANGTPLFVGGNPGLSVPAGGRLVVNATYKPADAGEKWIGAAEIPMGMGFFICGGSNPFMPNPCGGNGVRLTVPNAEGWDTTAIGGGPGVISIGFNAASVAPAIDVIPSQLDFGLITLGCGSEERQVKVYNTGTADLVVVGTDIDPVANPYEFKVTSSPVPPGGEVTVAPGSSILIRVRFYPRRVGLHSANLVITSREGEDQYSEFTVPMTGEGTNESHVVDVFQQLDEPKVDVLWVVDDSGSMSDDQAALAQNFPAFFSQTSINNVDYHIAVTTTLYSGDTCMPDLTNPNAPCSVPPDPHAGYYTACRNNDRFITRSTSNPQDQFSCNVNVSDSRNPDRPTSDAAEAGLFGAKTFLSQPLIDDPAANGGFMRDDAKLYVIMMSDEEDQSPGPTDLYVDFFLNLKGFRNRSLVSVSAIAGRVPGGCGEQAEAGARYKDVVDAVGNGIFEDLCAQDWGNQLTNLAFDSFGLKSQFFLSRGADPARITVCTTATELDAEQGTNCAVVPQAPENPSPSATGYFYDTSSNSVVFNPASIPQRGQWIRVEYDAQCLPMQP